MQAWYRSVGTNPETAKLFLDGVTAPGSRCPPILQGGWGHEWDSGKAEARLGYTTPGPGQRIGANGWEGRGYR